MVNVEVVVTDRSGDPIRGLTRENFVVREDGEVMELTNFYAVEGAQRAPSESETGPGAEDGGFTPLPADQRLNLVVLVDEVHISPTSRSRVLKELQQELDRVLRPGDRVLVARATPTVQVEQPFTQDLAAVSAILEGLRGGVSLGSSVKMEERDIRRALRRGEEVSLERIRTFAARQHQHNLRLLDSMSRFVEALAGLPGRRAVLYVSEGMTARPAESLMEEFIRLAQPAAGPRTLGDGPAQPEDTIPQFEADHWDATPQLVRLTEAAAGSHVTFYTLDAASGFHSDLDPELPHVGPPSRLGDSLEGGALADLAWRTGGASVAQGGSTEALVDRMAADYRDYYSLGYTSPHSNDGEYHRIEVEVPGHRVRLRHTQGFRATTPEQETVERTLSALVFDAADNPLAVQVEVGEEQKEKRNRYVLPILVRIPIASLTLLPGEASYQGRVSVVLAIRDLEGGLSEPQQMEVPVEIPNERLREAIGLQVAKGVNLLLKEGESTLAVGVRDHLSGTTSTVNVELAVGGGG